MISHKTLQRTLFGLFINTAYGLGNAVLGIATNSRWLITLSAYYLILSVMRFSVILFAKKNGDANAIFIKRFSGYMFFVLDIVLIATTYFTVTQNIGRKYHEIIMISIALYTFTKAVLAIVNLIKSKRFKSPVLTTLRNISLADAAASVFSLQRSMLVSFGEMKIADIKTFNILTGSGVCLIIIILGINLTRKENFKMSKLTETNKKIADNVKKGYNSIEKAVVGGYKKVENTVTGTYTKIEDAFVDKYLAHDGESLDDAKKRIKSEIEKRKEK